MRTSTFAAAALVSLLVGCSGDAVPEVFLLPCPAHLFSMEQAEPEYAGQEVPAREVGASRSPQAAPTSVVEVGKVASVKASLRNSIPASFFERSEADVIVAKDRRPTMPSMEDGYAALGGGMVTRQPATPTLRGPLHLGSSDALARIPSSTRRTSPASPRTKVVKEQQAPVLPLSQELIAKTVQGQLPRIRACYERVIKHEPTARGRILLSWTIRADGGVERVEVVEDEVGSEQFRGCAARSVAKWRFPVGAQSVAVSYPFHMTSRSY